MTGRRLVASGQRYVDLIKSLTRPPLVTIIGLFVVFGGGSLAFREYFSRRDKRLELAAAAAAPAESTTEPARVPAPRTEELEPVAQTQAAAPAPETSGL